MEATTLFDLYTCPSRVLRFISFIPVYNRCIFGFIQGSKAHLSMRVLRLASRPAFGLWIKSNRSIAQSAQFFDDLKPSVLLMQDAFCSHH